MSKCLPVVAFALLVLTGAMGLRNIAAAHAATSVASTVSTPAIWGIGGGVPPVWGIGGGVPPVWSIGGGVPPLVPGQPGSAE
jgi:hypothetical protein